MKKIVVITEYADILRKYMKKFSLEAIDIAYLANSIKKTISSILDHNGSLMLETAEAIANSFGLHYYQFGNPKYPIPPLESLPAKTQHRIAFRKKEGLPKEKTYSRNAVNERIKSILATYKIGSEFLAEEIANKILSKYGETYPVSEIVDRFKKTFKSSIEKTGKKDTAREGRGPKPIYYILVKKEPVETLAKN
ncbi:hypothetical protein [Pedobacter miscanthi]|uniref:hypothetical protein n=1 Tax=Pedobacter miscanthi TaxID=2259170 RepID=UPI00292CF4F1|nr:hypothetical protein [Pedobacter miscanthi]